MRCPIMYEPGKWGVVDVPEKDLEKPELALAFSGNDVQVPEGAPRSLSSMTSHEIHNFSRIVLMKGNERYNVYI